MRGFFLGKFWIRPDWIIAALALAVVLILTVGGWNGYLMASKIRIARQQIHNLQDSWNAFQVSQHREVTELLQTLRNDLDALHVKTARLENEIARLHMQAAPKTSAGPVEHTPVAGGTALRQHEAAVSASIRSTPSPMPAGEVPFAVVRLQFLGQQKLPGHIGLRDAAGIVLRNQTQERLTVKMIGERAVSEVALEPFGMSESVVFRANRGDNVLLSVDGYTTNIQVP